MSIVAHVLRRFSRKAVRPSCFGEMVSQQAIAENGCEDCPQWSECLLASCERISAMRGTRAREVGGAG